MKRETVTTLYGIAVFLMVLAVCIAYANVTTELKVEGEAEGEEQEGVYIANVEYLTNNGADTANSEINFYIGTMLDSKVVLGSSSGSSITYKVTMKNNTDREQVFIGIVKDESNEGIYSNTNIQPNVATAGGITGLEEYVTTIAPGETIIFPVTFAYAGTDTSNQELQGKINFRFREKSILELSNNGETYTLENIAAGHEEEYQFTVSNYNENYTNGVPMTYSFETTLTSGSPLTAKIYNSSGTEITGNITMSGDINNPVDHTYTLKIAWDSSLDSTEYEGKSYTCTVNLTAIPDTTVDADLADYADYSIEQGFEVNIATCSHTWKDGVCTICGKVCSHSYGSWQTVTAATCGAAGSQKRTCSICNNVETQSIAATGNHTYGSWVTTTAPTCVKTGVQTKTCTVCGDKQTQSVAATGNHSYGSWVTTTAATCTTAGQRERTCSNCTAYQTETIAALGHTYENGECTKCGAKEPLPTTTDYVGCYADMDRDGTIDGVIFADQGYGMTGTSQFGNGLYEIPKIESGLKEYYVSQESYTITSEDGSWDSNAHPVISPVEGTTGTDRFYVMKLSDLRTSTFYWYYSAHSERSLDDIVAETDHDFGEGYEKTGEMMERWNNETYGAQNTMDIWGQTSLQTEYTNGWFVPSKGEWSAFGGELGITKTNYSSTYGLRNRYWSSTQKDSIRAWRADFITCYMNQGTVSNEYYARLCTTF